MMLSVYTALFGDSGDVLRQQPLYDHVQYVAFTDRPQSEIPSCWIARPAALELPAELRNSHHGRHNGPRLLARLHKTSSTWLFPYAEATMWLDATLQLRTDPRALTTFGLSRADIASHNHPVRSTVRDEAEVCRELKLDAPERIQQQLDYLAEHKYPDFRLTETKVVLRRVNPAVQRFEAIWREHVLCRSLRDQLSFDFSVWASQVRFQALPQVATKSPWFAVFPHRRRAPVNILA